MNLPQSDSVYLNERGVAHEIAAESDMTCVVMLQWPLPSGFDHDAADLLVRLNPGYPDIPPDMWWFSPPVNLANGASLPATDVARNASRSADGNAGRDTSATGSGSRESTALRVSLP